MDVSTRTFGLPLVVLALGITACNNIASARADQDKKLQSGSRATALTEYKASYDAHPDDSKAAYLYARSVDDAVIKEGIAAKILAKDPQFAWAHELRGQALELKGRFDEAISEYEKGGDELKSLAEARKQNIVHVASAQFGAAVAAAMQLGDSERDRALRALDDGSDLDAVAKLYSIQQSKADGVEMLAVATAESFLKKTVILLFVKNTGTEPLVFHGEDVERGWTAACFTKTGERVLATPNVRPKSTKPEDCRMCADNDVKVLPGEMRRPAAVFEVSGDKLSRCAFNNIPRAGAITVVPIPAPL